MTKDTQPPHDFVTYLGRFAKPIVENFYRQSQIITLLSMEYEGTPLATCSLGHLNDAE